NQDISENDLAKSIGADDLDALTRHTGLSRGELLAGLRRELPGAIDELTPDGRVPSGHELSRRVSDARARPYSLADALPFLTAQLTPLVLTEEISTVRPGVIVLRATIALA